MSLPIRVFWLMNSNVGRLLAEKDLRALAVASGSQSTESVNEVRQHLVIEMGNTGETEGEVPDAVRDQAGVDELKALATLM